MILYDRQQKVTLYEFGIEIPVSESRVTKTFNKLKSHTLLGERLHDWHISKVEEEISRKDLLRVHSKEFVEKLHSDQLEKELIRAYELMDSKGKYYRYSPDKASIPLTRLYDTILHKVAGTLHCCRVALERDFCFYFGGGFHHAQRDYGNGFCLLNDIVIAIRRLQAENLICNGWVIDLDAHKGDGTAALTEGDHSITTLSIHMAEGWPLDGEMYNRRGQLNPSFIPSDIDIPIAAGEEDTYVTKLRQGLATLESQVSPDIAIVVSGADPYENDELPSATALKLSLEQLLERDLLVYNFLKNNTIPRAYLMAGGYGESSWQVYAQFLEWALLDKYEVKAGQVGMSPEAPKEDGILLGIISDTHGHLRPEVAEVFSGVDLIIHAGDIGNHVVLEALRSIAPVHAVRGNMDGGWAHGLPATEVVEIGGVLIYVLHDAYLLDLDPAAAGFAAVINGHTHKAATEKRQGVLFLNPGSASPYSSTGTVALLQIRGKSLQPQIVNL